MYAAARRRTQIGLILSYKYWWHRKEPIWNDNSVLSGRDEELHLQEVKSSVMNGFSAGIEFTHYKKAHKNFDFNFFWNATLTYFNSYSHVYSISELNWFYQGNPSVPKTYPYNETKTRIYFNLTCGFKLGYKKPLKQK